MKVLFIALFPFLLSAQSIWYVNRDTVGRGQYYPYDGTSWNEAWYQWDDDGYHGDRSGQAVDWDGLSAGDTLYVSGGADSTVYRPDNADGYFIQGEVFTDDVIVAPAWHADHNGDVYFINSNSAIAQTFVIQNCEHIKLTGFKFLVDIPRVESAGNAVTMIEGGKYITFDNCEFTCVYGTGTSFSFQDADSCTVMNSLIELKYNTSNIDNDVLTLSGANGGHLIKGNTIRNRNRYIGIAGTADEDSVTVTDTSVVDRRLNMITDYHAGSDMIYGAWSFTVTSNVDTAFYGAGWTIGGSGDHVGVTDTSMFNEDASWTTDAYVGATVTDDTTGSTMVITSNSATYLYGSAGWTPSTPANVGTYHISAGGGTPVDGKSYRVWTSAHRDFIQQSHSTNNDNLETRFINNFMYCYYPEALGWNQGIYGGSNADEYFDQRYVFINNVIMFDIGSNLSVTAQTTNFPESASNVSTRWYNNTVIVPAHWQHTMADTVIAKNNIFISTAVSPANPKAFYTERAAVMDIDYNYYSLPSWDSDTRAFYIDEVPYNYGDWQLEGYDVNSDTGSISLSSVRDSVISAYATPNTLIGTDLSALASTYPEIEYDINGDARTTWYLGAVNPTEAGVDSTPSNVTFIADYLNAELNTQYTGHIQELTGFDSGYVHIDRGWYNIDGGAWKPYTEWTKVFPTNDIYVRDTSAATYSTSKSIIATIGNDADTFTVTTKAEPSTVKLLRSSNGKLVYASNGKIIKVGISSAPAGEPDTTPPAPPTSFTAIGGTDTASFNTTWTNPSATDLDSIRIYEGSSNDTTTMTWVATVLAPNTSYLRTGRATNTTYWCAAKAVDDSGNVSYFSNTDSAKTSTSSSGTPLSNLDLVYLTQSTGQHLYNHSTVGDAGETDMPAELTAYNTANGTSATITRPYPGGNDYPACGDMIWHWNQVFYGGSLYSNTQNVITEYAVPSTYSIISVNFGFNSAAIWYAGWLVDETDTVNNADNHVENVYKYFIRQMVATMELYPDKYWILWNIPPEDEAAGNSSADVQRQANFNLWMTDTLQAGLDATYGAFPSNVYIFDIFTLLKAPSSNWMNPAYSDGGDDGDSHANADGQDIVASAYIQQIFDNARVYRIPE